MYEHTTSNSEVGARSKPEARAVAKVGSAVKRKRDAHRCIYRRAEKLPSTATVLCAVVSKKTQGRLQLG